MTDRKRIAILKMGNQAGIGPGLGVPKEEQRTAEEIALVHAAMMEELGIGRMDTLPLEDRGQKGNIPIANVVKPKKAVNEIMARWQNLEFDDVDESFNQLDNIADGQLYRLRRGHSSGTSHSPSLGGYSAGRGGRGRQGPSRGDYSGVGRGSMAVQSAIARQSTNNLTSFIDARHGPSKHARLERALSLLRAPPRSAMPSSRGNHHQAMAVPSNSASSPSSFAAVLATPQDFLRAMGLQARPPPVAPTATVAPVVPNQSDQPTPQPAPAIIQPIQSVFHPSGTGSTGLSGSRWASPQVKVSPKLSTTKVVGSDPISSQLVGFATVPPVPVPSPIVSAQARSNPDPTVVTPILIASSTGAAELTPASPCPPPSNLVAPPLLDPNIVARTGIAKTGKHTVASSTEVPRNSNTSSVSSPGILKEYLVKANRNGAADKIAKARLKGSLGSPLILELEVSNVVLLHQPLSDGIFFQFYSETLTFFIGSDAYNIKFRLPHEASAFVNALPVKLQKRTSQSQDQPGPAPDSPTIQIPQPSIVGTPDINNIATAVSSSSLKKAPTTTITPLLVDVSDTPEELSAAQTLSASAAEDLVGLVIDFEVGEIIQMLDIRCGGSFLEKVSTKGASEEAILCETESIVTALVGATHCSAVMSQVYIDAYVKQLSKRILAQARLQPPLTSSEITSDPVVFPLATSQNTSSVFSSKTTEIHVVPISQAILPTTIPECNILAVSSKTAKVLSSSDSKKEDGTVGEAEAVNSPPWTKIVERAIRYSVDELISLRDRATIFKQDLKFERGILEYGVVLPPEMRSPSHAEVASKSLGHIQLPRTIPYSSKGNNPTSSAVSPILHKPMLVSQIQKVETPNATADSDKTDPALFWGHLSSIGPEKPDNELFRFQSRGRHRSQTSVWDMPRLTKSLEDLKIAGSIEPPAAAREIPQDTKAVTTHPDVMDILNQLTKPPAAAFPAASNLLARDLRAEILPATSPSVQHQHIKPEHNLPAIAFQKPTTAGSYTLSSHLPAYTQSILDVGNKKEDLAKAKLPGLSSSRWASNNHAQDTGLKPIASKPFAVKPAFPAFQPYQPVEPQYGPVYQTVLVPDPITGILVEVTGIVKAGSVPVVAHQLVPVNTGGSVTAINYQENLGYQRMPFSPRPSMYNRHTSSASSTSDFKPEVSPFNPAPRPPNIRGQMDHSATAPSSLRQPLSPIRREYVQGELQSRLDRSISERVGSSPVARNK